MIILNVENKEYFNNAINAIQKLLNLNWLDEILEVRKCYGIVSVKKYKNYKIGLTHYRFKTSI